eukprot:334991_1
MLRSFAVLSSDGVYIPTLLSRGFHIFFFVVSSTLSPSAINFFFAPAASITHCDDPDIPALCMRYYIEQPMIFNICQSFATGFGRFFAISCRKMHRDAQCNKEFEVRWL